MKKLILISIVVLLSSFNFAYAQIKGFDAEVISVADGDSFTFRHSDGNLDKVRLLGLDAPEVAHNSREISQPFGDNCRTRLSNLIAGKTVTIETTRRDNYGRNLARVVSGGEDVNLAILTGGCGWIYYPNGIRAELRGEYEAAFVSAKANRTGLFASAKAITPQVWRKKKHRRRRT